MTKRLQRLGKDESGMTYVFIGLGLMALLSASMLAIDVGMLMTARNQAQNSADAGALAGATALAFDNYNDRTPTGPAVTSALAAARANQVMYGQVSVNPADVVFLNDPSGQNDRVKVTVYRQAARGNAVATLIARFFGTATADIGATATAEAAPSNAMTCVKPFTIPDKWIEKQTGPWDPDDSFDVVDKKGNPVVPADVYIGPEDPANYTGYNAERDAGLEIILKADNGTKISPSMYQAWDMPLYNSGGADYRTNIATCNTTVMGYGELIAAEPGMMTGPTAQGMQDLIAKDPSAYWDNYNKKVVSSMRPSPRVIAIPLFDPVYYDTGKRNGNNASLKFVNYLGFFVEEMQGNLVKGRVTPIGGLRKGGMGPAPETAFPRAIRLVQ
jgi:Flp pilus assembly protein TadG